jgi:hypothetical protein
MNASYYEIVEQEFAGVTAYHWLVRRPDGSEFAHSAYHDDREACEREAQDRLAYYREQGWVE